MTWDVHEFDAREALLFGFADVRDAVRQKTAPYRQVDSLQSRIFATSLRIDLVTLVVDRTLFQMIDHDSIHWSLTRLEFEPELLNTLEYCSGRIRSGACASDTWRAAETRKS